MKDKDTPKTGKRKGSFKATLLLAFIFIMGIVTGIGGTAIFTVQRLQETMRNPEMTNRPVDRVVNRLGNDLESHLNLTTEESEAVRSELSLSRDEMIKLRVQFLGDVRSLVTDTVNRIETRLPEDKHDALRKRARKKLEPWGLNPGE